MTKLGQIHLKICWISEKQDIIVDVEEAVGGGAVWNLVGGVNAVQERMGRQVIQRVFVSNPVGRKYSEGCSV